MAWQRRRFRRDGMATQKVSQQFTVITIEFAEKILVGVQNFSPIPSDVTKVMLRNSHTLDFNGSLSVLAANRYTCFKYLANTLIRVARAVYKL